MMATLYLQSHVLSRLRLGRTLDVAIEFGNLRPPVHHLHGMIFIRTSHSKSTKLLPRKRNKTSSPLEKINKPLSRMRIKKCKSLVTTDCPSDQFDHFLKITKLLEDDKRKHSLLTKTMKELLDAIANSRERLQHIEPWIWDLVESDQKRQLLVKYAIDGLQEAGIFTLLADGKFTLDRHVKKAPNARVL